MKRIELNNDMLYPFKLEITHLQLTMSFIFHTQWRSHRLFTNIYYRDETEYTAKRSTKLDEDNHLLRTLWPHPHRINFVPCCVSRERRKETPSTHIHYHPHIPTKPTNEVILSLQPKFRVQFSCGYLHHRSRHTFTETFANEN